MTAAKSCLTNHTYQEIELGAEASLSKTLTSQDIQLFATVTGDMNPAHLDEAYAKTDFFHQIVGHGMWTASMFSVLLGVHLPGPGTIYLKQTLTFLKPVHIGDCITASVVATKKEDKFQRITFTTRCVNQKGECILEGEALVRAPSEKVTWETFALPPVQVKTSAHTHEKWLLDKVKGLSPLKVAVVHPVDAFSLAGAVAAAEAGVIVPFLVGPEAKIKQCAEEAGINLYGCEIVSTEHSHAAAELAVSMAKNGQVESLMKGKLHTDELMHAVLNAQSGLRTGRRASHVFVLDVPSYPKPLFLTDSAINIRPTLMAKKDIVQNAIDLFVALKLGVPKVAILSAIETVNENLPSTLDATALCKMAERGQIWGGILDGPLAFDNAISRESAKIKGIVSKVAGESDILVVPDIESGNMLYKELRYFSGAQGSGIVLGTKVPVILTSRAADVESRVASSALALLYTRCILNGLHSHV